MKKSLFLALISILCMLLSLGVSSPQSNFGFQALYRLISLNNDLNDLDILYQIFIELKAPRILLAFIVGALLSSSGAVIQGCFLNPLADPYIIGIASAATFGSLIAFMFNLSEIYFGLFAFLSCILFTFFIFSIYKKNQNMATLLILGIATSTLLASITSFFIYLIGEDSFKISAWLMGYLGNANWNIVVIVYIASIICILYFYIKRYELDLLLCGDEEANSLGLNASKSKKLFLIISCIAVAFSVAFCGLIAFIGLIIPHTLRMYFKTSSNKIIIPYSIFIGGIFLLFCDNLAFNILYPIEIPVGIITSFFGVPLFVYLALRKNYA